MTKTVRERRLGAAMTSPDLPQDARAVRGDRVRPSHGGLRHDESGPFGSRSAARLGFATDEVVVVPDELADIERALRAGVDAGVDLVATTGAPGSRRGDVTPEATRQVLTARRRVGGGALSFQSRPGANDDPLARGRPAGRERDHRQPAGLAERRADASACWSP